RSSTHSTLFPYTTLFRSNRKIRGSGSEWRTIERADCGARAVCDEYQGRNPASISRFQYREIRLFGRLTFPQENKRLSSEFDNLRSEEHTSELQSRENLVC